MKGFRRITLCALALNILPCTSSMIISVPNAMPKLVVFGDSLSDNGNTWKMSNHTWPSDPAYYEHTFSNGPVWVDYLAEMLGLELEDYAVGGATSDNTVVQGYTGRFGNITVPSLVDQFSSFLRKHGNNRAIISEDLYVILIGANNILLGEEYLNVPATVHIVVEQLYRMGASRILIAIPPDAGLLPYKAFIPAETSKKLSDLSKALQASLYGLFFQPPLPAKPAYVDLFSLFNEIMDDPELYGFLPQTVNVSCLRGAYGEVPHRTLCSDPGQYIFWDEYHPTTVTHRIMASKTCALIKSNSEDTCNNISSRKRPCAKGMSG